MTTEGLTADKIAALPYRENVGVMLLNVAGEVLVGQRLDNRTAAWQMPQGGIDPGEDPRTAALRELQEEPACALIWLKLSPCPKSGWPMTCPPIWW